MPPARTVADAQAMLGDRVSVYLDGGDLGGPDLAIADVTSTIVDATSLHLPEGKLRIMRQGVISHEDIVRVVGAELVA
jgi:tRNA A37 threonylcarbamoyladenosine synthetase subunit TsaC/SUA5/YrdC